MHCFIQDGRKAHFFLQIPFLSLNLFDKGKCVFLRWFSFHFHFAMSKQNCLMMMVLLPEREIFYHSSLNNIWLFKKMIVILQNGFLEIWWCNGSTTIILSFHLRERENFVKPFFSEKLYNSIIIIILPAFGYNITNWCPLDNSSFLVTRILTIIMT